ncbi:hypothetical protein Tco_0776074 [Tanacetum coccineum]
MEEYVAMLDELGLGDGRLLFSQFKIPCTCLDDGLAPLMADEDVVKLLKYMPSDTDDDEFPKMSAKSMKQERESRTSDQFVFKTLLAEIDLEIGYTTDETKEKLSQENPSLDEIFDDMNSSLENIIAKLCDFPTWVDDVSVDQENEVEWQHYSCRERIHEEEIASMYAELDQAYKENVVSHLDEPVVFEEVWDVGLFDNILDNEMTKDDSIDISCSIVPIRRSMKRKKVEFDETASEYAPTT